jgi:hypothetical protein
VRRYTFLLYTASPASIIFGRSDRRLFSQTADRRKYSISATKFVASDGDLLLGLSVVLL